MRTRRRILQGLAALLSACRPDGDWIYPDEDSGDPDPGFTPPNTEPVGTPYSTDATGWTLVAFDDYPQLLQPDGYAHVTVEGIRMIVASGSEPDSWVAMDRICTHEGCAIVISFGRFACPCHGSLWNDRGELTAGPALNQPVYPAVGGTDGVWVQVL